MGKKDRDSDKELEDFTEEVFGKSTDEIRDEFDK